MKALGAAVLVLALAFGCGEKGKDKSRDEGAPGASDPTPARPNVASSRTAFSAAAKALFAAVPGDAIGVAFIDSPHTFWSAVTGGVLVPLSGADKGALEADLKKLLDDRLGIDPSKVSAAVGYVRFHTMQPTGALLIGGVEGQLKGASGTGGDSLVLLDKAKRIVAAKKGDVVMIGPEPGVRAAFDTLDGKRESIIKQKPKVWSWLQAEVGGGFLGAAVWTDGVDHPQVSGMAKQMGVKRAAGRIGGAGVRVRVEGDKNKLADLAGNFMRGLRGQLVRIEQLKMRTSSPDAPLAAALGGILQYHLAKGTIAQLEPKPYDKGMQIVVPVQLAGGSMFVAMVGVLAAVAVPAFLKYIKKSKTSEARMLVKKLFDGAREYYFTNQKFPASVPMTPPLGSCCRGGDKCAPNAQQWTHPTWTALMFSVDDPHYYSYQFTSSGKSFTVRAVGDLDCDGEYATFEMHGMVDASGNLAGSASLMRIRELE